MLSDASLICEKKTMRENVWVEVFAIEGPQPTPNELEELVKMAEEGIDHIKSRRCCEVSKNMERRSAIVKSYLHS